MAFALAKNIPVSVSGKAGSHYASGVPLLIRDLSLHGRYPSMAVGRVRLCLNNGVAWVHSLSSVAVLRGSSSLAKIHLLYV